MIKAIKVVIVIIITSFAVFPFFFSFFPIANTKMIVAALGLSMFLYNISKSGGASVNKGLFTISAWALGVSFMSIVSMVVNNTYDDSYMSYIVSMWVWLGAAYCCACLMRSNEGKLNVNIIIYYFIGVALYQCLFAVAIYKFPFLRSITDQYVVGERYMGVNIGEARLYAPGCALDVGGGRLGTILIMIAYLMYDCIKHGHSSKLFGGLFSAFVVITTIGNMMGRTASVGALLALFMFVCGVVTIMRNKDVAFAKYFLLFVCVLIVGILVCIYLYNSDGNVHRLLRFGFEGFFNYFERGNFETSSTNMLSEGIIFPDNFHTWMIGDGYMAGTANDPYYIGPSDYGFYMNTDAGYSRFLFYFGILGLCVFIGFFINVAKQCTVLSPNAKWLFYFMMIFNFLIWIKVSTDIFVMFAPFLCVSPKDEAIGETHDRKILIS